MGVDHGGERGDKSPLEFEVGDANANCPLRILSYKYKKSVLRPSKYAKNPFPGIPARSTPMINISSVDDYAVRIAAPTPM